MSLETAPNPPATKPPPRRHYSRWRVNSGRSRIACSRSENTLGHLVDVGLGGFKISVSQPAAAEQADTLLLILDQFPEAPQMMMVKATPVWMDEDHSTGLRYAGFQFDDLKPPAAAFIAHHLKAHKGAYSVVRADSNAAPQRRTKPELRPARKKPAITPPQAQPRRAPLAVVIFGFSTRERQLLNNIVTLSALRSADPSGCDQTYLLQSEDAVTTADLVLVDADDANAVDACTAYLMDKSPLPTIKMTAKRRAQTNPHTIHIPRRFVPQTLLQALDSASHDAG